MPDLSTNFDFLNIVYPLKERLALYDHTSSPSKQPKNDATDPARAIPQGFIDAMIVREEVFVKEQKIPLENELDFDDKRCFTWTLYASVSVSNLQSRKAHANPATQVPGHVQPTPENGGHPNRRVSTSTKVPIGTIRLVPPPNTATHHFDNHRNLDGTPYAGPVKSSTHNGREPFIKFGRLALLPPYRGLKPSLATLVINSAIEFARAWPSEISRKPSDAFKFELKAALGEDVNLDTEWKGLVLVHAQVHLQNFWARYGFELDREMGMWDEEGIDHVGMWMRIDLKAAPKPNAPVLVQREKEIHHPFGSK